MSSYHGFITEVTGFKILCDLVPRRDSMTDMPMMAEPTINIMDLTDLRYLSEVT